jgi:hypothetical protein
MRRYRDNARALTFLWAKNLTHQNGSTTAGSWTLLFSFYVFTPDTVIDAGGTLLTMYNLIVQTQGSPSVPPRHSYVRLEIGATNGTQNVHNSAVAATYNFVITWSPSANTSYQVDVMGYVANTTDNTCWVNWNKWEPTYITLEAVA